MNLNVISIEDLNNDYLVKIKVKRIRRNQYLNYGDHIVLKTNGEMNLFKIHKCDRDSKTIIAKKFKPCLYVWTTYSLRFQNRYKVGIVNFQSVCNRLIQTDTTGVIERIELVDTFELNVKTPAEAKKIESSIHKSPLVIRIRDDREGVEAHYESILKPLIEFTIQKFNAVKELKRTTPHPYYYQWDAMNIASKHFKTNDRGWIQWFCGTGKTPGSYWIYELVMKTIGITNNIVVICVPSKQLAQQTHDGWVDTAKASGKKIRSRFIFDGSKDSINNLESIKGFFNESTKDTINLLVVTYQSSHKVAEAVRTLGIKVDMLICDEVHRITGMVGKSWMKVLDGAHFPARKILSMTASPVFYDKNSNKYNFIGMNNKSMFGKKFHTYSFHSAVFDGSIAPLELLGIQMNSTISKKVRNLINKNQKVIQRNLLDSGLIIDIKGFNKEIEIDKGDMIFYIQLHNTLIALKEGLITHPIIYANSVNRVKIFMACLLALAKTSEYDVNIEFSDTFTSDDDIQDRIDKLENQFSNSKIAVVGNCRCLQEGISINKVDGVVLIDPKKSLVDLIQIMGRPVRNDKDNPNKVARIIIPIMFKKSKGNYIFDDSQFNTTRDWLISLLSSDLDMESFIFNNTSVINDETLKKLSNENRRNGIDVRVAKKSKTPSIPKGGSGNPKEDEILPKVNFEIHINKLKLSTIISTLKHKTIKLETAEGRDEFVKKKAENYLIQKVREIDYAVQNYTPKKRQFGKYVNMVIQNEESVWEDFARQIDFCPIKMRTIIKKNPMFTKLIKLNTNLNNLNKQTVVNFI